MIFGQDVGDVARAVGDTMSNRSDTMIAAVSILGMVLVVMWLNWKFLERQEDRQKYREELDEKRSEKRETTIEELQRLNRELANRTADQLDVLASSMSKTTDAITVIAQTSEHTNGEIKRIISRQDNDRRAVAHLLEAAEADRKGDTATAVECLKAARQALLRTA